MKLIDFVGECFAAPYEMALFEFVGERKIGKLVADHVTGGV